MIFYLTVPKYTVLERVTAPVFVNRTAIFKHGPKKLPKRVGGAPWGLDSGGYMELRQHGGWTVTPATYANEVRRCVKEIGGLEFAAVLDWMTEPEILAKTGRSIEDHQALTVESYLQLRAIAPDVAHLFMPVLQGQHPEDYVRHFELYLMMGVDLRQANVVGIGSVCRRRGKVAPILEHLQKLGLHRLHGFGVKTSNLAWKAILERPTRPDVAELYRRAFERGFPYEELELALMQDPDYGATTWEEEELELCRFFYSADSAAWSTRARKHAQAVDVARFTLAELRGFRPEDVQIKGGDLFFGRERVGTIDQALAGVRPPVTVEGPNDTRGALTPTQMLPGHTHRSCNQCVPWALAWREKLRGELESAGCWQEAPYLERLPAPSSEWHRRLIEAGLKAAREWREFGPERFGSLEEMPRWAREEALRRRAAREGPAPPPDDLPLFGRPRENRGR